MERSDLYPKVEWFEGMEFVRNSAFEKAKEYIEQLESENKDLTKAIKDLTTWHSFYEIEPKKNQEIIIRSKDNSLYKPRVTKWDYGVYWNDVKKRNLIWKSWTDVYK